MSHEKPTAQMTENEMQAFLFGYIKGQQNTMFINMINKKTPKEQVNKIWESLVNQSIDNHEFYGCRLGIDNFVDVEFGRALEDIEQEVLEIILVQQAQTVKQNKQSSTPKDGSK